MRLGAKELRASGGEPRFGLRHVGARHLADIEAVAGLLELLGQHLDVAPLQIEHRLIAQQIHVGGRGIEQHLLLGDAQGLARGIDLAFRLAGAVGRLKAVEERVGAGGAERARVEILRELAVDERASRAGKSDVAFW